MLLTELIPGLEAAKAAKERGLDRGEQIGLGFAQIITPSGEFAGRATDGLSKGYFRRTLGIKAFEVLPVTTSALSKLQLATWGAIGFSPLGPLGIAAGILGGTLVATIFEHEVLQGTRVVASGVRRLAGRSAKRI